MTIDPAVACLLIASTALLFLVAAVHKLRDLRRFREVFAAYRLLPLAAGRGLAPVVPALELAVAVGLLFDNLRMMALWTGIALLLAYAIAIAVNLARGSPRPRLRLWRPQRSPSDRSLDGLAQHRHSPYSSPPPHYPGTTVALVLTDGDHRRLRNRLLRVGLPLPGPTVDSHSPYYALTIHPDERTRNFKCCSVDRRVGPVGPRVGADTPDRRVA